MPPPFKITPERLLKMTSLELDGLFQASVCGNIPDGNAMEVALIATKTMWATPIARFSELEVATKWLICCGAIKNTVHTREIRRRENREICSQL